ncbi:MAG: hypothetical protein ACHQQS_04800 [Thermoanaerobaculales bacterium]
MAPIADLSPGSRQQRLTKRRGVPRNVAVKAGHRGPDVTVRADGEASLLSWVTSGAAA